MDWPVKDNGTFETADAWMLLDILSVIDDMTEGEAARLTRWAQGKNPFSGTNKEFVGYYVNAAKRRREEK